jgi:HlyD family secretion protein
MRIVIALIVLVSLSVGAAVLYGRYTGAEEVSTLRTAKVERGDMLITVTASGTVEPEEVVDIGAQVVGRISELGKDLRGETDPEFAGKDIDYCSEVKKGMILAKIDPAVYQAQYDQAVATLERAKADLSQMEARASQTEAEWIRAQKLREVEVPGLSPTGRQARTVPIRGIADADYIMAKAEFEIAKSNVEVAKASILQAQSAVALAKTNLDYTVIESPVSGTILERRVNVGQTVVSSMNAPSLFLIAEDLRKMEVWALVNEADIGRIKMGQKVSFTVDAFPEDVFHGEVSQIRLNASMTQNVVIYTVVVSAANPDLRLLPYLTANLKFEIEERKNVLMVPNAALRFQPLKTQVLETSRESEPSPAAVEDGREMGTVWVKEGQFVRPIDVVVGMTDGVSTEVSGDGLEEGLEIAIGQKRAEAAAAEVNNPFAPPRFRGGRRKAKS